MTESASDAQTRSACDIVRTHQRFLLRRLEFAQQYAPMYRNRIEAQHARALHAIREAVASSSSSSVQQQQQLPGLLRVLELVPGVASICVGVVYKHMKLLPQFLDEYQRELVRVDAGGDDDDDEDGDGGGGGDDGGGAAAVDATVSTSTGDATAAEAAQDMSMAAVHEHYTLCNAADELTLEDSSGRILLHGLDTSRFCTGVVLGVYGTLRDNGSLLVHQYAFSGLDELHVPRRLLSRHTPPHAEPCYVAFVCGLQLGGGGSSSGGDEATVDAQRGRVMLELLLDFVSGNVVDEALFAQARRVARVVVGGNSIAATEEQQLKKKVRLEPSDHARLGDDNKTTMSTAAAAAAAASTRNVAAGTAMTGAAGVTHGAVSSSSAAALMRELDAVLARLCATVEVELMPGDTDLSDAFLPQQPLHPVLLPRAARLSTLRLVTNPYEFVATPLSRGGGGSRRDDGSRRRRGGGADDSDDGTSNERKRSDHAAGDEAKDGDDGGGGGGVCFFASAGQNVNDVARETRFASRLDAMAMMLQSGCACPTAPNTLFSYPFLHDDPFLFRRAPACFVACDQPRFETCYCTHDELRARTGDYYTHNDNNGDADDGDEEQQQQRQQRTRRGASAARREQHKAMRDTSDNDNKDEEGTAVAASSSARHDGVRLVCVPAFHRTGVLVLVDIHSPTLETTAIDFSLLH